MNASFPEFTNEHCGIATDGDNRGVVEEDKAFPLLDELFVDTDVQEDCGCWRLRRRPSRLSVQLGVRGRSVFDSGMMPRAPAAYNDRSKVAISMTSTLCGNSAGGRRNFGANVLVIAGNSSKHDNRCTMIGLRVSKARDTRTRKYAGNSLIFISSRRASWACVPYPTSTIEFELVSDSGLVKLLMGRENTYKLVKQNSKTSIIDLW